MKNIFKIMTLGLAAFTMTGCSDSFLDTSSKTESTTDNYFKTETDAYRSLIGCYDGWQCTVSYGPTFTFHYMSELLADDCLGGTGTGDSRNTQVMDRMDLSQDNSQTNLHNNLWIYYYEAIFRCNTLILYADDISWSSDSVKNTCLGEARALRGILYFDLVRIFENVPLITEPTTENVAQADPDSVYAQIVSDLRFAAKNIPSGAYPKSDAANNDGRITCYAAKALLARVYLFYTGVYSKTTVPGGLTRAEALEGLEEIIESGEYDLVDQYKNLWPAASDSWSGDATSGYTETSTYAGDGNEETLLAMKFNYTSDYNGNSGGNNAIQMFSIRGGTFKAPYGQGWGGATVSSKFSSIFETGDQRYDASVIDMQAEGIESMESYQTALSDQREYTGYFNKKYTARSKWVQSESGSWSLTHYYADVQAGDFMISQPQNYVIMRYADVLLMAAELYLAENNSTDALKCVNQVRKRAFTDDDGNVDNAYKLTSVTQDDIMTERHREFAFEGIRYWDLMRQGMTTLSNAVADASQTVSSGGVEETITYDGSNFTQKRGFQQIPLTQIQLSNNVLKQNTGW